MQPLTKQGNAMDLTFLKHFDDRYTQSRENQILDYLNQRGAAVPQVILNHAELGYLEMSHAGQNLTQWLEASESADLPIFDVLSQSVSAVLEVSKVGVWHLDIAPRNFVVRLNSNKQSLQVCLIDFGNAVSTLFPLQKPLWMRPSAEQHRLLRQALQQDWQSFYQRHGLLEPVNWEQNFDVPQDLYQADWTRDLQTEALAERASVLAHGLGQLLISTGRMHQGTVLQKNDLGASLLNLDDDEQALGAIESVLLQLQSWADASRATPRPTRRFEASASDRPYVPVTAQATTLIGSAIGSASTARSTSASTLPTSAIHPQTVFDSTQVPQKNSVQPPPNKAEATMADRNGTPETQPKKNWRTWLPIATCTMLMILAWIIIDLIYQAASASKPLTTTVLALTGVVLAALGTLFSLGGLLWSSRRQAWWRRLFFVNVIGQAMLVLELWVFEMPYTVIGLASLCPAIVLLVCALGLVERDRAFSH